MSGELVIDRGATSGDNRHFTVNGAALELKDVTLQGGYTTASGGAVAVYNTINNSGASGIFTRVFFKGNTGTPVGSNSSTL